MARRGQVENSFGCEQTHITSVVIFQVSKNKKSVTN